jgi:hypothetical protein
METDRLGREGWAQRLAARVDYGWTLARLWLLDRIAGPTPATEADVVREREMERLRRAFPGVDVDGTGPRPAKRQRDASR